MTTTRGRPTNTDRITALAERVTRIEDWIKARGALANRVSELENAMAQLDRRLRVVERV